MKPEQQVCSLELSKKLKKLGVKQESLFWWEEVVMPRATFAELVSTKSEGTANMNHYPAYTVAELGEMLPKLTETTRGVMNDWRWRCEVKDEKSYVTASGADTEADARAKMLIYLLENGLLNLE